MQTKLIELILVSADQHWIPSCLQAAPFCLADYFGSLVGECPGGAACQSL